MRGAFLVGVQVDKVRGIIAAGVQQYCNDLATEMGYHEPHRDLSILQRVHDDADGIADYIIGDGFKNAHIVGWITDDPSQLRPRRYPDEDLQVWAE